jgi:glycosyltransferase involved in cell wall biosynthesis
MTMRTEARDVTLCIPTIPPRRELLARCLRSWVAQTWPVHAVSIAVDNDKDGAGPTRNRAMQAAKTTWIALCDDDDEVLPEHLETLLDFAAATEADVVWPWYQVAGGTDPFPQHRGLQLQPDGTHIFPVCTLVRTDAWRKSKARFAKPAEDRGDDLLFWVAMRKAGAKMVHIDQVTWIWHHDSGNTSGLPWCW